MDLRFNLGHSGSRARSLNPAVPHTYTQGVIITAAHLPQIATDLFIRDVEAPTVVQRAGGSKANETTSLL